MSSALATKTDLLQLEQWLGQRMDAREVKLASLDQKIDALRKDVDLKMKLLMSTMTVRLGSLMVVGLGALFAALKLI